MWPSKTCSIMKNSNTMAPRQSCPAWISRTKSPSSELLCVFLLLIGASYSISAPESCHLREVELCTLSAMSIIQNPAGVPVKPDELKRQCELLDEAASCFKEYGETCLTKDQFNLVRMFTSNVFDMEKDMCNNGSSLQLDYLKNAACYRKVQKKYQNPCLMDLQAGFEFIHKNEHNQRLPLSCCNINRMKECLLPRVEEECGQLGAHVIQSFLEHTLGAVAFVTCRNYDPKSELCLSLLPEAGKKPLMGKNSSAISRTISAYTIRL